MELCIVFLESLENIEKEISDVSVILGKNLRFGLRYISFEDKFPVDICYYFKKYNLVPIITWEMFFPSIDGYNRRKCLKEETHLNDLLNGKYDEYIDNFAVQIKLWEDTVYLRPLHEFNADWYVWGGEKNGGKYDGPELIKKCWIYLVNKFRVHNVNNVKWIWCVHEPSAHVSMEEWNNLKNYWPGDEYVDMTGIDGFNFYPENPEREDPDFYSFDSLFQETYKQLISLSSKSIFIMTGTSEFSYSGKITDKSDWINDAFENIRKTYKKISIVSWFHHKYSDKVNWRLDSSEKSLKALISQFDKHDK